MPIYMAVTLYPIKEVCEKLAILKDRGTYARQQVDKLIKKKLPTALKIGNLYFLTDNEIMWLASQITVRKGTKIIDTRQLSE
jgi:hypothetical protein